MLHGYISISIIRGISFVRGLLPRLSCTNTLKVDLNPTMIFSHCINEVATIVKQMGDVPILCDDCDSTKTVLKLTSWQLQSSLFAVETKSTCHWGDMSSH